jgi:rSAM/selenodomain-associated transferase 1
LSRGRLVVFAKQPLAGAVKTRLTPPLGASEAAELYACMLQDVLAVSAGAARELDLEAVLALHPGRVAMELAREAPAPFRVVAQCGMSLPERMEWAVGEAAAAAATPVLLRGSDSPMLAPVQIGAALDALSDHDVVIVPDRDGGYSLVGLARPVRGLFEHAMSTRTVAEDTRSSATGMGLSTRLLEASFDVDTVEDLALLAASRQALGDLCPRTLGYLDEHDLWRHLEPAAQGRVSG